MDRIVYATGILSRVLSSAWATVIVAVIALLQTWRIAQKNRKHEKDLAQLQQKLTIQTEKTKAAYGEHRILADKVYRAAFKLDTAVRNLDFFFTQFTAHLGKVKIFDMDIQRVKQFREELQMYDSDARRLGGLYLTLSGEASFNSLKFTSDIALLEVLAEQKRTAGATYKMTEDEWKKYHSSSESALKSTKLLVDELMRILGEVEIS